MRLPMRRSAVTRFPWKLSGGGSIVRMMKGFPIRIRSSGCPTTRGVSASR